MTRLSHTFGCGSLMLAGTLDTAPGSTGLLIVSGGNEIRSGAFGGQADMAARIAAAGYPDSYPKVGLSEWSVSCDHCSVGHTSSE